MSVLTGTSADWPHRCLLSAEGLHGFPFDNYIVFNTRKLLLRHLKFKTLRQKSHWWLFKSWFSIWYFPRVRVLGTFTSSAAIWASSCPYIHFTNIHPRFQLHFFLAKEHCHVNQKCSGLSQGSPDERSLEVSELTSDTCPLMCDISFETSLSSCPAPCHLPPFPIHVSWH